MVELLSENDGGVDVVGASGSESEYVTSNSAQGAEFDEADRE